MTWKFANYFAATAVALCALARAAPPVAPGPAIVTEDLTIPALDAGIKLQVRNKRPAGATKFSAQRIVLFVHGATCPSASGFDFPLEGGSWLERLQGIRANASKRSHAELNEAPDLDAGDPVELGSQYSALLRRYPQIRVLGGCCGTDDRHVACIGSACRPLHG